MLSIVVPVYNVEKYLSECLSSLVNQSYSDIEIIIVDDGSTDNSLQICNDFANQAPNIRIIEKTNGGLMSAWMTGVENSFGDYIGFVDSDDYVDTEMYEKMMEKTFEQDVDIVMCGRKHLYKNYSELSIDSINEYYIDDINYVHENSFPSMRSGNISLARWNKIYKKEILLSNLKYCRDKSRYFEDRFIVPAALLSSNSFAYIPEPLYFYRMRKGANSKTGSMELLNWVEILCGIQKEMLSDKKRDDLFTRLDIAILDYIKVMIERNIRYCNDSTIRIESAKRIINSNEYSKLVKRYPKELVGKMGLCIKLSYWFKSPHLLLFFTQANNFAEKLLNRNNAIDWYE